MLKDEPPRTWMDAFLHGVRRGWAKILGGEDPGPLKLGREDPGAPRASGVPSSKEGFLASAAGAAATGSTEAPGLSWSERTRQAGYKIIAGGEYRLGKAVDAFLKQFPPQKTKGYKYHVEKDTLPLTPRGRVMREQENVLTERRLRKTEADARRQARIRAAEEVRRLRLEGYDASAKRGEIERRVLDELLGRNSASHERIEENRRVLAEDERQRRRITQDRGAKTNTDDGGPMPVDKSLDDLVRAVKENTKQSQQVYAALTGANSQLGQGM